MTDDPNLDRQGTPWTKEEEGYLKWAYAMGVPVAFAAMHVGRTVDAVKKRAGRMGLRHSSLGATPGAGDLATALMELQGLRPPQERAGPAEPLTEDALRRFVDDPVALFAWLGVDLHPYQREGVALIQASDRVALCWSRQAGKDLVTGLYALWLALVRPGAIVVCVSPSQRQSDLWLQRVQDHAFTRPEVRDALVDLSQSEVGLSNRSRIYSLPSGVGGGITIRGFSRVSLLIFNEAAFVDPEVYRAASPFLAAAGDGKAVLISTPWGRHGPFWDAWQSDLYARSHVAADACPHIAAAFLAKEKETMDALSFASEYNAAFVSSASSYYPVELVEAATKPYNLVERPQAEHADLARYAGWDPARVEGGDRSVVTVLGVDSEGLGRVLGLRAFEGVPYNEQVAYVVWLHGEWGFRRIYVDASAHALVDELRARGLPVDAVSFSLQGKVELHSRLKAAFEARKLTIPRLPDLLRELAAFEYAITPKGNLTLHGGRDDHVDALALAARPLTRARGKPGAMRLSLPRGRPGPRWNWERRP